MATQTIKIEIVANPTGVTIDLSTNAVTVDCSAAAVAVDIQGAVLAALEALQLDITVTGAISALRVVKPHATAGLEYCDADTAAHGGAALGVVLTATGAGGGTCRVVISGLLTDASWSWTPGAPIYCGANGILSADPSVPTAFAQQIATAQSATTIVINVQPAIRKG